MASLKAISGFKRDKTIQGKNMRKKWAARTVIAFIVAALIWFVGMPTREYLSWILDNGYGRILSGGHLFGTPEGSAKATQNLLIWSYTGQFLTLVSVLFGAYSMYRALSVEPESTSSESSKEA